ncbi:MAG TPA: alpha/beta fold hydrolase [Actinomycetota bacterium]
MTDALLLIHAFPLDASMWEPQVESLTDPLMVLAPNLPGFGGAEGVGNVMTMGDAASACLRALDEAGADRAVVCGLSMGGYVAFELWRQVPDRVAGLVLANTRAGADDDAGRERRLALASRLDAEGNGFLVESPPPLLSEGADDGLWGAVKATIAAQPAASIAAANRGMAQRPDSRGDLAAITVPTMVVTSTGDTLIPQSATIPMADQIPDAQLEIIDGAGHLSNVEAPGEFTLILERHLTLCGLL